MAMSNMQHIEYENDVEQIWGHYRQTGGKKSADAFAIREHQVRRFLLSNPEESKPLSTLQQFWDYPELDDIRRLGLGEKPKNNNFIYNFIEYEESDTYTNYILTIRPDAMRTSDTIDILHYRDDTKYELSEMV
jgi:hypothetical protein